MRYQSSSCRHLPATPVLIGTALLLAGFGIAGCALSHEKRDLEPERAVHSKEDISVNAEQFRLRMRSLLDPMSGRIEAAADRVIAETDDHDVKRAAIEWKSQAIPSLREALFQPRPLTALFDTWVFMEQMRAYFAEGPGRDALKDSSPIAVETCLDLEGELFKVAASLTRSGDVTRAREFARQWAARHPITTEIRHRETTLSRVTELDFSPELDVFDTVDSATVTFDDLNRRFEVYSDQLVRQARWEVELLLMDLTHQFQLDKGIPLAEQAVDSLTISLETLLSEIEHLRGLVESAPDVIARERAAAINDVHDELTRSLDFAREERRAVLVHITNERIAALKDLIEALDLQRKLLSELVVEQRKTLTEEVRAISIDAIDHAFLRAAQLTSAVVAVMLIAALVGLGLVRRTILSIMRDQRKSATKLG